ncbi:multidrug ABC transporter ATP-binding protein [Streptomyces ruber]|uniref:Multidrug ABC transporter ATP-binding protein n=2 Tax=Streptomyces TaxID=1883 RepID=A0A918BN31_9ACTN|nr:ABC transporter ATP-binding protein [Streptomyces ruber]GGQ81337.1 multidrug ABC transporter ATP-binding protein [Streptomyces ruber]
MLEMAGVRHGYDDRVVVAGVDLSVGAGECVVLLGENGSGKSTLLRLAAGRERPEEGTVTFLGRTVSEDDVTLRAEVAVVLDGGVGYPDLSVREHLMLVALAHGLGQAAGETVDDILREHRLDGHADALPHQLSSGQTQLMALAQAFVRPCSMLILDEPEQRIDTDGRGRLAERLLAAKADGTAVLLATHDRTLAAAVADAAFTVSGEGRLVEERTPRADGE